MKTKNSAIQRQCRALTIEITSPAKVTVGAVMVLLSPFTIKYNITGDAVVHLLKLISLMLPDTLVKYIHSPLLLYNLPFFYQQKGENLPKTLSA